MQSISRYLVTNKNDIVVDWILDDEREYRKVYQRDLKVYKGIDNDIQFVVKNADQKPVDISTHKQAVFIAMYQGKELIRKIATIMDDGSALVTRGKLSVTVTENDLLNLNQGHLSYSIYLIDSNDASQITYSDTQFGVCGNLIIEDCGMPQPKDSIEIVNFHDSGDLKISDAKTAEPGINGNEALHTATIYAPAFTGDLTLQATLYDDLTNSTTWFDVATVSLANESEPKIVNSNGVFSHVRFTYDTTQSTGTIDKILLRN
jgi:hypothetical protein